MRSMLRPLARAPLRVVADAAPRSCATASQAARRSFPVAAVHRRALSAATGGRPATSAATTAAKAAPTVVQTEYYGVLSPREGLPRWPGLTTSTGLLRTADWVGTVAFAMSGSLTAATCGCDLLGCMAIGTITAVGGGTIRDAIILRVVPFWVEEWEYLVVSAIAAGGVFFLWGSLEPGAELLPGLVLKAADGGEGNLMDWGDALGLGAFAAIGAMNGIRAAAPPLVVAICGMSTCTFGGATRDTLLNRPVRILHPYSDMYAPLAFGGAAAYTAMRHAAPQAQGLRIAVVVAGVMAARYGAWTEGWRLPFWERGTGSQKVVTSDADPRKKDAQLVK